MNIEIGNKMVEPSFADEYRKRLARLNLRRVYSIAKSFGSPFDMDSPVGIEPGFKLFSPGYSVEANPEPKKSNAQRLEIEKAKILVVDDEESVRMLGADILSDHGFRVITACDGADGLKKLEENPDIRVVIMDMIMPVMSGKEACIKMKGTNNPPKILICTGFSESSDLDSLLGTYAESLLRKPYTARELISSVENLLGHSSSLGS